MGGGCLSDRWVQCLSSETGKAYIPPGDSQHPPSNPRSVNTLVYRTSPGPPSEFGSKSTMRGPRRSDGWRDSESESGQPQGGGKLVTMGENTGLIKSCMRRGYQRGSNPCAMTAVHESRPQAAHRKRTLRKPKSSMPTRRGHCPAPGSSACIWHRRRACRPAWR
jgi:hypothetical protein